MKKIIALALAMALACSLASCGKPGGETSTDKSNLPSGAATSNPQTPSNAGSADSYPEKAIKMIIPYSAGGASDMGGRVIASCLPTYLPGATIVVENQAGGAAVPGTLAMATSDPDGYTIGYNWYASYTLRPQIMETGYAMDDYKFICGITTQMNTLYVTADSPFQTFEDLISYMKEHPGELNYSCGAAGSFQQLICGSMLQATGTEAVEVPYEGARPSALAMMSGDVDFCLLETATCTAELSAGTVRPLASFESKRNEGAHPDCPTIGELGYSEVAEVATNRTILCVPAATDQAICDKLEAACEKLCQDENFLTLADNVDLVIEFVDGATVKEEIATCYDKLGELLDVM